MKTRAITLFSPLLFGLLFSNLFESNAHRILLAKNADSTYFSLESECNYIVKLRADKTAHIIINNLKYDAQIKKNKNSSPYNIYYDVYANDKLLFQLMYDEGDFTIPNQQYQFACEGQKAIFLSRKGDNANAEKIKTYIEGKEYVLTTPNTLNDKGYYLEQAGLFEDAILVLNLVIEKFPQRTVAYINLGDSYWGLKDQTQAKEAYNKYIDLMKKSGKEAKIPKRVYERIR